MSPPNIDRHAVILAGGTGSRLGQLTKHTPKPLLTLAGKPFLLHLIDILARYEFGHISVLCGPYKEIFEELLKGYLNELSSEIALIDEPTPAGTGGALRYISSDVPSEFLLVNGDSYFPINLKEFCMKKDPAYLCTVALCAVADTRRYGRVHLQENKIVKFQEKMEGADSGLISAGIYYMSKDILERIPDAPVSLENEIFPTLASEGLVQGITYDAPFIDIGTPEDLSRADLFLREVGCV